MVDLASLEFLTEFIELYRSFPCLWQVKCKEYSNRKKDLAYADLVDKYREVEPTADRNTVVKKISSLRTVYKKEVAKVKNSEKSGASAVDIYEPKLWYFPLLNFLSDQDTSRKGKSTIDDDEAGNLKEIGADTNDKRSDCADECVTVSSVETITDTSVSPRTQRPPTSKRKLNPIDQATTDALQLVGKKITSLKDDDSFDVYGKYVADRLRKIHPNQVKFVQKLFEEVMFEAEMDSLNRYCKIVGHLDPGFHQVNNYQNFGQQPVMLQTSGFAELRGPGQQPFMPQTSGFSELRDPGQQNFAAQPNPTIVGSAKKYIDNFDPNATI